MSSSATPEKVPSQNLVKIAIVCLVVAIVNSFFIIVFLPTVTMLTSEHWVTWVFYRWEISAILAVTTALVWTASTSHASKYMLFSAIWTVVHAAWSIVALIFTCIDLSVCSTVAYCVPPAGSTAQQSVAIYVILFHCIISILLGFGSAAILVMTVKDTKFGLRFSPSGNQYTAVSTTGAVYRTGASLRQQLGMR